jgi:anti-sigma28 factor (negative regulator of flagellin synthesis)
MRITNDYVARLLEGRIDRTGRASEVEPGPSMGPAREDRVLLSLRSEDVRAGLVAAQGSGNTDPTRVAALAREVREGRYQVPPDAIAEALLRDLGR